MGRVHLPYACRHTTGVAFLSIFFYIVFVLSAWAQDERASYQNTVATAGQVCKDNNQAVIALATKQNLTISGCGDEKVKSACSKFTELLEKCCETCAGVTKDSAGGASPPKALGGNPFASNNGSITATAQSTTGPLGGDSSSCARRSRGRRVILQAAAVVVAMAMC